MILNKRCLSAFKTTEPHIAFGTKSKLFDPTFSSTSELFLYDYLTNTTYDSLSLEHRFNRMTWIEGNKTVLAAGLENGNLSIFSTQDNTFTVQYTNNTLLTGDVLGLDYNRHKNLLAAGSENGRIVLWSLDNLEKPYSSGVSSEMQGVTSLAWNPRVSHILCAGTADGRVFILDLRQKKEVVRISHSEIGNKPINKAEWHPHSSTSLLIASEHADTLLSYDLSNNTLTKLPGQGGVSGFGLFDSDKIIYHNKEHIGMLQINTPLHIKHKEDNLFDIQVTPDKDMLVLSYLSGVTEVTTLTSKIPCYFDFLKKKNAFSFLRRGVLTQNGFLKPKMKEMKFNKFEKKGVLGEIVGEVYCKGEYFVDQGVLKKLAERLYGCREYEIAEQKGLKFNSEDEITQALIRGDYEQAFNASLSTDLSIHSSYLTALLTGTEFLKDKLQLLRAKNKDERAHLLLCLLGNDFSYLIDSVCLSEWYLVASLICSSLSKGAELKEKELDLYMDRLGDRLSENLDVNNTLYPALMCYAIANNKKKYFALREKGLGIPDSIFKVLGVFEKMEDVAGEYDYMGMKEYGVVMKEYVKYCRGYKEEDVDISALSVSPVVKNLPVKMEEKVAQYGQTGLGRGMQTIPARAYGSPPIGPIKGPMLPSKETVAPVKTYGESLKAPPKTYGSPTVPVKTYGDNFKATAAPSVMTYGSPVAPVKNYGMPTTPVRMPVTPVSLLPPVRPSIPASRTATAPAKPPMVPLTPKPSQAQVLPTASSPVSENICDPQALATIDSKISFLKTLSQSKKGVIYKNKINDSLRRLSAYEKLEKNSFSMKFTDSLLKMVDNIKEQGDKESFSRFRMCYDGIMVEYGGSYEVEIWLPGVLGLYQVVMSDK